MAKQSIPWWSKAAGALAIVGALGIGAYFAWTGKQPGTAPPGSAGTQPLPAESAPPPAAVQHPIEQAGAGADANVAPLPSLSESDAPVLEALAAMLGGDGLSALLNPQHVIQRIVATVDSLPRQKLAIGTLPVRGAQGTFATSADGTARSIDAKNFARYDAYARIAQAIDAKALVAWYVRFYPLFQESYRELGYPNGYFNDRLIAVIDHLLSTPDVPQPVALTQPNVMYEYADPTLEARSAGQKLLIRSGPTNEAAIKAKLREIRAALTGQTLPATPTSAAGEG